MGDPVAVVRVMLVDDHEIVRRGVAAMLGRDDGIIVCGQASSAAEALEVADATMPDVVVMDVRLNGSCGIETTREIRARRPATKVIMLTTYADDDAMFSSIMAGASGYVLKQILGSDLVGAVRSVAAGQSLLDPSMTNAVLDRLRQSRDQMKDEKLARLSTQEERILTLVAQGMTNKGIGVELFISEKTVKNHVSHILQKLQMSRRSEAAAYLTRHQRQGGS